MGPKYGGEESEGYAAFGDANTFANQAALASSQQQDLRSGDPRVQYDPRAALNATNNARLTGLPMAQALQQGQGVIDAQNRNIAALEAQATGQGGPSPAQLAMQQQAGQNIAAQYAMARGAGGAAAGGAMRNAQQQAAMQGGQLQAQLGIQRANEQQAAQQALIGATGQARGQQQQRAGMLQGAEQAAADFNLARGAQIHDIRMGQTGVALQDRAQRDAMEQYYGDQVRGYAGMDLGARMAYDQAKTAGYTDIYKTDKNVHLGKQTGGGSGIGPTLAGAGAQAASSAIVAGISMSDKRVKKDVQPASAAATQGGGDYSWAKAGSDVFAAFAAGLQGKEADEDTLFYDDEMRRRARDARREKAMRMAVSDKRAKTDTKKSWEPVKGKSFRYKGEPKSVPRRTGVMAQDLEKSDYLRNVVVDTPAGKGIDMPRAVSAVMASSADFDKRLKKLERGR